MPTLAVAFLLFGIPESTRELYTSKSLVLLLVVGTTFIVPLISMLMMRFTKTIASMHLNKREERIFPFSMVSFVYMMTTYFFYLKLSVDATLVFALAVMTICVVILTSITFFWKISAHMTGISGLLAIMTVFSIRYPGTNLLYFILTGIIFCGALASARLFLNTHTPMEILGGFILGFWVCFASFYYLFV
jgi:membrane-associated phospholipid phosphatase